jgi:hypothetical protein
VEAACEEVHGVPDGGSFAVVAAAAIVLVLAALLVVTAVRVFRRR